MKYVESIVKNKTKCYFVSPHLDDAVLSAGGLIDYLSLRTEVTIITVFTNSGDRHSLSAKQFMKQCQITDPSILYKKRREEDIQALTLLNNCKVIHLGKIDALWRVNRKQNFISKILGMVIPEFILTYPTYRFHVIKGDVSQKDNALIYEIGQELSSLIDIENAAVFCPLGIGKHVDHLVTRKAVEKICTPLYWVDQPYALRGETINVSEFDTINTPNIDFNQKNRILNNYKTQIGALFEGSEIPKLTETFYSPSLNRKLSDVLPKKLGNYHFDHEIVKAGASHKYIYAQYSDTKHKKAFAKAIIGKPKSRHCRELWNSIKTYDVLQKTLESCNEIQRLFPHVRIPKKITSIKSNAYSLLLLEQIVGQNISKLSKHDQFSIYTTVINYLEQVSTNLKEDEIKSLSKRRLWCWVLLTPFISFKAILNHPHLIQIILKSTVLIFINYIHLFTSTTRCLVHRDISSGNIIENNQNIYVFDFQLSCISDPSLDYAVLCIELWNDKYLSKKMLAYFLEYKLKTDSRKKVFYSISLFLGLYNLILDDGVDPHTITDFLGTLHTQIVSI